MLNQGKCSAKTQVSATNCWRYPQMPQSIYENKSWKTELILIRISKYYSYCHFAPTTEQQSSGSGGDTTQNRQMPVPFHWKNWDSNWQ